MMHKVERENTGTMRPGQDLVVAGFAGLAGTVLLTRMQRKRLESWFSDEYLELILSHEKVAWSGNLEYWKTFGATECEPAGEGGILTALWNLSGAYETGIEFSLRQIPVKQETIEVCERLELNPYRLYSKGCCLLVADNGGQMVKALAGEGIFAQVIGKVNRGIAREILSAEGHGYLDRPQLDEMKKVVPDYVFI